MWLTLMAMAVTPRQPRPRLVQPTTTHLTNTDGNGSHSKTAKTTTCTVHRGCRGVHRGCRGRRRVCREVRRRTSRPCLVRGIISPMIPKLNLKYDP